MRFGKTLPIVNQHNKLAGLRAPENHTRAELSQQLQAYLTLPASDGLLGYKFILPAQKAEALGDLTYLKQFKNRFGLLIPASEANFLSWQTAGLIEEFDIIWQLLRGDDIPRLLENDSKMLAGSSLLFSQAEMQLFLAKQKGAKLWLLDSKDSNSLRLSENLEVDWLPDLSLNSLCNNAKPDSAVTRTRLLRLLSLVVNDADTQEIESLFKQDSHLSYQLLKLVSSAAFALTVEIKNFKQAINLLGRSQLQRWLQLLLYTNPGANQPMVNPLLPRAAFRARLMETILATQSPSRQELDVAYMVGIFSLLDQLLAMPMQELIAPLHLDKVVSDALLYRQGALGEMLSFVDACDDVSEAHIDVSDTLVACLPDQAAFDTCLLDAYAWVAKICAEF